MSNAMKYNEVTQTHVSQAKTLFEETDVPYTGYLWGYHKGLLDENPMGEELIRHYVETCQSPDPRPKNVMQWLDALEEALQADPVAEAFQNIP